MIRSSSPRRRGFLASPLRAAVAALALAGTAHAGFETLQGQYNGRFSSRIETALNTENANGPARANVKAIANGKRGRINIFGSSSGQPYRAKIEFRANGICTASAIAPGIDGAATGTWKANLRGNKVQYTVTRVTPSGAYTAKGSILGTGEHLQVRIAFTGQGVPPGAPTEGAYSCSGSR